jgi:hypothetical protein
MSGGRLKDSRNARKRFNNISWKDSVQKSDSVFNEEAGVCEKLNALAD